MDRGIVATCMAQGECHECGAEIAIGMWDDPALSGAVVLLCMDCADETPEACLWDVSALEEAHSKWPGDDDHHPNLVSEHPLDEGESWAIQNRYETRERYLTHLKASWTGTVPDDFGDDIEVPDDECWDLFIRDAENTEAIRKGRDALRSRLDAA